MVLVDFTLAERWRVFGELSLAPVQASPAATRHDDAGATRATALHVTPRTVLLQQVDPQESAARSHALATLMQRML
jgi:hypothetical protein